VYAVVGDKVITQYELETLNPKRLQMIYNKYTGEERKEALDDYYQKGLNLLIDNYVIEQAASREGVRVTNKEMEGAMQDIMERNNVDEEKLSELLAASNQTIEQYKWKIKIDILKSRLMSTVFRPKIIITDDDIKNYVAKHTDVLELSDMYELRLLVVDTDAELKEAMADFNQNGSFRDTVMKYSKASNAETGGYIGWVELAFLDDEIRAAVAGVKQGVTKPLKGDDGYRVFYVEGFRNKGDIDKDKKEKIIETMQEEQSQKIFEDWLKTKKKEILIQKKYAN